jgi:antitoxin PrlF
MAAAILTAKGQLTLPKPVRERLGVKSGDRLRFRFDDEGRLILEPLLPSPSRSLEGLLGHLKPSSPVSLEAMNEAIANHLRNKHG